MKFRWRNAIQQLQFISEVKCIRFLWFAQLRKWRFHSCGTYRCVRDNRNQTFRGSGFVLSLKAAMSWKFLPLKTRTPRNVGMRLRTDAASCSRKNLPVDEFICPNEVFLKVCHLQIQVLCSSRRKLPQFQDVLFRFVGVWLSEYLIWNVMPVESCTAVLLLQVQMFHKSFKAPLSSTSLLWISLLSRLMIRNLEFVSEEFKIFSTFSTFIPRHWSWCWVHSGGQRN